MNDELKTIDAELTAALARLGVADGRESTVRLGHDFQCEACRKPFIVPFDEYHGQWDHPPSVPVCDECEDAQASA